MTDKTEKHKKKEKKEVVYVIPLRDAFRKPTRQRAKYAIKAIKSFLSKHLKVNVENVKLSSAINAAVFARGIEKIPRKVSVTAKLEADKAMVYLTSEYAELSKKQKVVVKQEEQKQKKELPEEKSPDKSPSSSEQKKERVE